MGFGSGAGCAVVLNSGLSAADRARFQAVATINRLLAETRTIAMVGLSADRQKASYFVANYLQTAGYRIIPVNPKADRILGEPAYPDLLRIPFQIDLVNLFRPSPEVAGIVREMQERQQIVKETAALWTQLRIIDLAAARQAEAAGFTVVLDKCLKMEHARYQGGLHRAGMNTEIISARRRSA